MCAEIILQPTMMDTIDRDLELSTALIVQSSAPTETYI